MQEQDPWDAGFDADEEEEPSSEPDEKVVQKKNVPDEKVVKKKNEPDEKVVKKKGKARRFQCHN